MTAATAAPPVPKGRPILPLRELTVVAADDITPRMRRVILNVEDPSGFSYEPGQSLILKFPAPEGDDSRREYTIRSFDPVSGEIALDFLLHGATPGPEWARTVQPGTKILSRGPRGRTVFNAEADWHLFLGDETCIPAILHILETVPSDARVQVFLEVSGPVDEQPVEAAANVDLSWVYRNGTVTTPGGPLLERLELLDLPEGTGHAYIIGETSNVRAQRHHLVARGLTRAQISSEGYWRPGRIGGHDHVED